MRSWIFFPGTSEEFVKVVKNGKKKQENRKRLKANTVSSRFLAPRLKEKNKAP